MVTVGLTGGIGTGKSFVLQVLRELGCYTMRADELAREIVFSPDSKVRDKIISALGPDICDPECGLKKERVAEIIFHDPVKRQYINRIVHPLVAKEQRRRIREIAKTRRHDFFIYESALLAEAGTWRRFDTVVVVYAAAEIQVQRLMARDGISAEEANRRIQAQFPLKEKLRIADYTIDTSGEFEQTRQRTLETYALMRKDFHLD